MVPSLSIDTTNRVCTRFIITDTTDDEGDVIISSDLTVVFPDTTEVTIDLYPQNFENLNEEYVITKELLDVDELPDGVYTFTITTNTSGDSETSEDAFFLHDCNTKSCWLEKFEATLNCNCATEEQKELVSYVRELIQGANEAFAQFKFSMANNIIEDALAACGDCDCGCNDC